MISLRRRRRLQKSGERFLTRISSFVSTVSNNTPCVIGRFEVAEVSVARDFAVDVPIRLCGAEVRVAVNGERGIVVVFDAVCTEVLLAWLEGDNPSGPC